MVLLIQHALKIVVQSEYNYDSNYAYIPTNSITIVSNGSNSSSQLNTSNVEGQPTGKTDSEPTSILPI